MAAWYQKGSVHEKEEGRAQREERRALPGQRRTKREERDQHDQDERVEGGNGSVPEWRDGTENGRPLEKGEGRAQKGERREKQEESDQHDQDERVEIATVRSQKGGMVQKTVGPTVKMRGLKEAKVRSQNGGMVPKRVGP